MKFIPNRRRLAASCLYTGMALAWLTVGTWGQMGNPTQWNSEATAPMSPTSEGQPINKAQTPESLLLYVDHEVQKRIQIEDATQNSNRGFVYTQPARVDIYPGLDAALIPMAAKFGVVNLLAALQKGPSVREGDLSDDMVNSVKNYENMIFMQAIRVAATKDDLPVLIAAVTSKDAKKINAGLVQFIVQNKAWADDSQVSAFVLEQLDSTTGDGSVAMCLRDYAVASKDPNVEAKLASILQDRIGTPVAGEGFKNMMEETHAKPRAGAKDQGEQLDYVMGDCLKAQNQPCIALMPAWVSARLDAWLSMGRKTKQKNRNGITDLTYILLHNPEYLAEAPVKEAVATVMSSIANEPAYSTAYDFFAAAQGDRKAFEELAEAGTVNRPDQSLWYLTVMPSPIWRIENSPRIS